MLIAQISDSHVAPRGETALGGADTAAALERAVGHVNRLAPRPDLVVATGDLAAGGTDVEYGLVREILAPLAPPLFAIPGNHDVREGFRRAFAERGFLPAEGTFLHYTVEGFPLRLIALDTLVPGEDRGALCAERLAWAEARLAEGKGRPSLILMHHPPFASGIAALDRHRCAGHEALAALVGRHGGVVRVLCGHIHRPIAASWAGTVAMTGPSVARQMELSLDPERPFGWADEPAALALHLWRADEGMVTHLSLVDAGGP